MDGGGGDSLWRLYEHYVPRHRRFFPSILLTDDPAGRKRREEREARRGERATEKKERGRGLRE